MASDVSILLLLPLVTGLRISGSWESGESATVLAKFGFQQTDSLNLEHTRGYIYGNITAAGGDGALLGQGRVLLVLASKTYFPGIHAATQEGGEGTCPRALKQISGVAFDHKCMPGATQDFFRWVPCPRDKICPDEDEPKNLVPGTQFTYRTQDKYAAGFWYLMLLSCHLTEQCNWTASSVPLRLNYDIWLVNGNPELAYRNPFEHQFSYDEQAVHMEKLQDTAEIYMVAFVLFLSLSLLQSHGVALVAKNPPKRLRALRAICWTKTVGITWNLLHVFVYSFNGRGLLFARWLGDVTNMLSVWLMMLLVILLARGWSIRTRVIRSPRFVLILWGAINSLHLVFFVWNSTAVDDIEEIDIFETYPGYGILILRVLATLWFVLELRKSVIREERADRATFLVHFGAGFLVWFLYLPLLGLFASRIDLLWRFKTILCVAFLADFVGMGMLIHILWPRSQNRRYFLDEEEMVGMVGSPDALEDFEMAEEIPDDPGERLIPTHSSPSKATDVPPHLNLKHTPIQR